MVKTKNFSFLIIGFGSIGKRHAKNLRYLYPESRISVLKQSTKLGRNELGRFEHVDIFLDSFDDALMQNPDAAIISSPSPWHIENATACARENKNVY